MPMEKLNSCFIYVAVDNSVKEQFTINVITKVTRLKEVKRVIFPFDGQVFSGQYALRYRPKNNFLVKPDGIIWTVLQKYWFCTNITHSRKKPEYTYKYTI